MKRWLKAIVASACVMSAATAAHSATYPDHLVQMIVPYPPGGITDTVARIITERFTAKFGQPFIVDNRPGAGGITGSASASKADPDGYTLLFGSVANTTFPAVNETLPYDLVRDFTPVCRVMSVPNYLVVGMDSPYRSVKDLVADAKANPGKLTFASTGPGATPHLSGELFKVMAGIDMVHVPYKGSGPAFIDLIPGRISMMFDNAAYAQVKAGKLRALAVSTPERSPAAPDVPTVAEAGVPGFAVTSWYAVWARKGTPDDRVEVIKKELQTVFGDRKIQDKMVELGGKADLLCGDDFAAFIDAEIAKWRKLVTDANIKIN